MPTPARHGRWFGLVIGDDFSMPFRYRTSAGVAINLTGFSVKGRLWWGNAAGITLTGANFVITDAVLGKFKLVISDSATVNVPVGKVSRLSITLVNPALDETTLGILNIEGIAR